MIPTYVLIPVRDQWSLTEHVLDCLAIHRPVSDVLILDNGSLDGTADKIRLLQRGDEWGGRLHRTSMAGHSIYEMWNHGFARAKRRAAGLPFNVLCLNNDVSLAPRTVELLAEYLRAFQDYTVTYPDYDAARWDLPWDLSIRHTRGVFGDGGMFGPCFMLAGERITWEPLITDASYRWWYGDNHLAECIEQEGGKQVRVVGLPIRHENEGTAQHYPELYDVKLRDRGLWVSRHSRGLRAIDRRA